MEILQLDNIDTIKNPVVTIGKFNGVHTAHTQLLKTLVKSAQQIKGKSIVITFDEHPAKVMNDSDNNYFCITDINETIDKIAQIGVDYLIILKFDKQLSAMSYDNFIDDILCKKLHTKQLLIGYNNTIGKNRGGNVQNIHAICNKLDIEVVVFHEMLLDGYSVSSTLIRKYISEGQIEVANRLLGYDYFIVGEIKSNVFIPNNNRKIIPRHGTYQVSIESNGLQQPALCKVGTVINLNSDVQNMFNKNVKIFFKNEHR